MSNQAILGAGTKAVFTMSLMYGKEKDAEYEIGELLTLASAWRSLLTTCSDNSSHPGFCSFFAICTPISFVAAKQVIPLYPLLGST